MDKQEKSLNEQLIINSIKEYASAYKHLDFIQSKNKELIPVGDQKTGAIGEFIGKKIIETFEGVEKVKLADNPSQKGYDVEVEKSNGQVDYIQIKTVSSYNKKQRTSPFKPEYETGKSIQGLLIIRLSSDMLTGDYLYIDDKKNSSLFGVNIAPKTIATKQRFAKDNSVRSFKLVSENIYIFKE